MKNKVREVSVLFIVASVSAFLLSFVYKNTKPVIEEYASKTLNENLLKAFPDSQVHFETVKNDTLWKVYKGEAIVGIVFRNGRQGYSSLIRPIVGVDLAGRVIKILIPKEGLAETPGLGMKVTEGWFQEQFSGLTLGEIWLRGDNENGKIDGITAATISSRAATAAVREGLEKFKCYLQRGVIEGEWYVDDLIQLSGVEDVEELIEDRLWKAKDRFVYLSYGEGFISQVGVLVSIWKDTVLAIHIQCPEEGMEETPGYGTMVASVEFESRFGNVYIGDIDEVNALSGATMTCEAVKKAIKSGYEELMGGSE